MRPAQRARQVDRPGGLLVPPGVQDHHQDLGHDSAVEIDQGHVAERLLGDPRLGVRGQLEDEQAGLGLPPATGLDQAVGQAAGLDDLGLQRPPLGDVVDPGQAEDRVAVVLDQPLAAPVVLLHRERCSRDVTRSSASGAESPALTWRPTVAATSATRPGRSA